MMLGWLRARRTPPSAAYRHLSPGRSYVVAEPFTDHDGIVHPRGEQWTFRQYAFLPYGDGLSLFVEAAGAARQIRLQQRDDAEGRIIARLADHVHPLPSRGDRRILKLTRDSVCLADDVDAPHTGFVEVDRGADLAAIARAILAEGYLAWVGCNATWHTTVDGNGVVFGYRYGIRFVQTVRRTEDFAATPFDALHIVYDLQEPPDAVAARL